MERKLWSAMVVAALWSGQAQALNTEDYDIPYVGVAGLYEIGDSARDSDNGYGLHLSYGFPLESRPGAAIEISGFTLQRDRDIDGEEDYQRGLIANYVHEFGQHGRGDSGYQSYLPAFKPYLLGGGGLIQEDVRGDKTYHFGLNIGGGLLFPIAFKGWAIRTEAVAQAQINDESVQGRDVPLDFQLRVGLQIPLSFLHREQAVVPQPLEPVQVVPVEPAI